MASQCRSSQTPQYPLSPPAQPLPGDQEWRSFSRDRTRGDPGPETRSSCPHPHPHYHHMKDRRMESLLCSGWPPETGFWSPPKKADLPPVHPSEAHSQQVVFVPPRNRCTVSCGFLVPARNTRNTSGRNPGGDRDKAGSRAKPKETRQRK